MRCVSISFIGSRGADEGSGGSNLGINSHNTGPMNERDLPAEVNPATSGTMSSLWFDLLKSKRLTSAQPIPFSDILAHLVSTLGHPDLLLLIHQHPWCDDL